MFSNVFAKVTRDLDICLDVFLYIASALFALLPGGPYVLPSGVNENGTVYKCDRYFFSILVQFSFIVVASVSVWFSVPKALTIIENGLKLKWIPPGAPSVFYREFENDDDVSCLLWSWRAKFSINKIVLIESSDWREFAWPRLGGIFRPFVNYHLVRFCLLLTVLILRVCFVKWVYLLHDRSNEPNEEKNKEEFNFLFHSINCKSKRFNVDLETLIQPSTTS